MFNVLKHLQKHFANVLQLFANVLQMFYFTCNHGLTIAIPRNAHGASCGNSIERCQSISSFIWLHGAGA